MTSTTNTTMALVAGMIAMLVGAFVLVVQFDQAGLIGMAIGVALGLLNMGISYTLAVRSMKKGLNSAMGALLGGFFVRLILLAALTLVFQKTPAVDAAAFGLAFMILFFVNLLLEVQLVGKTWQGNGGTA